LLTEPTICENESSALLNIERVNLLLRRALLHINSVNLLLALFNIDSVNLLLRLTLLDVN